MKNKLFLFDEKQKKTTTFLIGTDEAGRGPGAGPVYAAAVCFKAIDNSLIKTLNKINDSKQLNESVREELFDIICQNSLFHIAYSNVEEIEKLNILQASLLAMKKACNKVIKQINDSDFKVLVDGNKLIPQFLCSQQFIIKGDSKSASIAAASILAKVSRDRFMKQLALSHPHYNWQKNKGYLTQEHLKAIDDYGITTHHRKKFLEKHFEKSNQLQFPQNKCAVT